LRHLKLLDLEWKVSAAIEAVWKSSFGGVSVGHNVVLFEDDGVDLKLDFLNLKVDINFFVDPLLIT